MNKYLRILLASTCLTIALPSYAATTQYEVKMVDDNGDFDIPVKINDSIVLNFILDSGASMVSIPLDVFSTLVRTGTIVKSDIIGKASMTDANGNTVKVPVFIIKKLQLGNHIFTNIRATVGNQKSPLLLGETFLKTLKSWSIDNNTSEFIFTPIEDTTVDSAIPTPATPTTSATTDISACGRDISIINDQLVGVWTGNWTKSLCGVLIIDHMKTSNNITSAQVTYLYGYNGGDFTAPGGRMGGLLHFNGNILEFTDHWKSTFTFVKYADNHLGAYFTNAKGMKLSTIFRKIL